MKKNKLSSSLSFLKIFIFSCVRMSVSGYDRCVQGPTEKKTSAPLELRIRSFPAWMLWTEIGSFGREIWSFNHWNPSPVPSCLSWCWREENLFSFFIPREIGGKYNSSSCFIIMPPSQPRNMKSSHQTCFSTTVPENEMCK